MWGESSILFKTNPMKSFKLIVAIFVFVSALQTIHAQSFDQLIKDWERAKAYTQEYLDIMPESGYGLKPTPEMRSFAEQMLHLTEANYGLAAAASGEKSPVGFGELEKTTDKSKENVTRQVMAGYDFVITTLKNVHPDRMQEMVKIFDRFEMTREVAFIKCFEHQTHHRGQTTVYIRLAGAKPPQEKLF